MAVLESAFGAGLGVELDFSDGLTVSAALFGESRSRFIVSVDPAAPGCLSTHKKRMSISKCSARREDRFRLSITARN